MSDTITFMPEDLDSVLSLEDLASVLKEIILEIRHNDTAYNNIKQKIQQLEKNFSNLSSQSSIQELFDAYKNIQIISLELRKALSNFITLDTYDSIAYAFYFQGTRYSTEHFSLEAVQKKDDGSLWLNLDDAIKEIKDNIKDLKRDKVNELFTKHYQSYLSLIQGTYKGKWGTRVNEGTVSEAFESHISSHHTAAYQLLNSSEVFTSTIDKMVEAELKQEGPWHEGATEGWIHIRGALGTQKGVVAGDVGRFQVKSTKFTGSYSKIRLTRLSTLKNGVQIYSEIISGEPVEGVALKLARYLSEPVKALSVDTLQKGVKNLDLNNDIEKFMKQNRKINVAVHI